MQFGAGLPPRCVLLPSIGAAAHFPLLLLIGSLLTSGDLIPDSVPYLPPNLHHTLEVHHLEPMEKRRECTIRLDFGEG